MNPRRILFIVARLIALAAIAHAVTIWIFYRSISTPIERHYLSAYFWSSLPLVGPSTVEVRLIWKTGRRRKRQLATDTDVVSSDEGTRLVLSQSARDAGWKVLIEGPPQQVPADLLNQDLAGLAFEDQSLWDLLLLPELSVLAALGTALGTGYLLIGFFRALPSEIAWRRRYFAFQDLSASFSEEGSALLRTGHSRLKALHQGAGRRMSSHNTAPHTTVAPRVAEPTSFALPLFGVYSGSGEGYLWTERDAIE